MHISPLGDSALVIQLCERLADRPEETLREVVSVWRRLEVAALPGVVEVTPAYTTVALYYDPLRVIKAAGAQSEPVAWLTDRISAVLAEPVEAPATNARLVEIPIYYGGKWGPDPADLARLAGLTPEQLAERHAGAFYLVHCLGFTPGFPYLSGLPPEARRAAPDQSAQGGASRLGWDRGAQTGVYPVASPGGWHLIGRTPLRIFEPRAESPALLQVGDRVRFRPISARELNDWPA